MRRVLALLLLSFVLPGCQEVNQFITLPGFPGGNGGGGTPADSPLCVGVDRVKVTFNGNPAVPVGPQNQIAVGGTVEITATPFIGDVKANTGTTGWDIEWSSSGNITLQTRQNVYNRAIYVFGPGGWAVTARVCGQEGTLTGSGV